MNKEELELVPTQLTLKATPEMIIAGARSIGRSMRDENHNVRAEKCWKAMIDAFHGIEEPKP